VVPGVNVAQLSARDVNITTRAASSALATSQLALVDGRTIYLDFFGMVMWDLVPTDPNDIRRIEVIRGPASAVWGFTDTAYWQDVLDARFAGTTDPYTLVNGSFGVRWAAGRVATSIKGINLANQQVMQHIFGDVLKRQFVGEVRATF
jgi:hypothetical protein